jgi:hypothetical protein
LVGQDNELELFHLFHFDLSMTNSIYLSLPREENLEKLDILNSCGFSMDIYIRVLYICRVLLENRLFFKLHKRMKKNVFQKVKKKKRLARVSYLFFL